MQGVYHLDMRRKIEDRPRLGIVDAKPKFGVRGCLHLFLHVVPSFTTLDVEYIDPRHKERPWQRE